ncbi:MAG: hypothetical protein MUO76_20875 [Anaerolineaceae bacterium]|nr:hypothetical protein [Anaerolineaceae bacterium]
MNFKITFMRSPEVGTGLALSEKDVGNVKTDSPRAIPIMLVCGDNP